LPHAAEVVGQRPINKPFIFGGVLVVGRAVLLIGQNLVNGWPVQISTCQRAVLVERQNNVVAIVNILRTLVNVPVAVECVGSPLLDRS
jgi:hypothetical protein